MTRLSLRLLAFLASGIVGVLSTPFDASAAPQCDERDSVTSGRRGICSPYQTVADAKGDDSFVGRSVVSVGFCRSEEAATILAERVAENGDEAYRQVMSDPKVDCLDTRFPYYRNLPSYRRPFNAVLGEFLWRSKHKNGKVYLYFWSQDKEGERAIIWQSLTDLQGPGA